MHTLRCPVRILTLFALLEIACSPEPPPDMLGPPADAGATDVGADAGPPAPSCTLELSGPSRVSAGGRLELGFAASSGAEPSYELPEGWRVLSDERGLTIRTAYDSVGELTLTAHARCGEERASATLSVRVEAPRWRTLGDWSQGLDTNPGLRQLGSLLLDPADPESILLYGGFSAERQGYVQELWAFDTARARWEMVADVSRPDMFGGETIAPIPGEPAFLATDAYSGWDGTGTDYSLFRVDYEGESMGSRPLPVQGGPKSGSFGGALSYVPHLDRYLLACGMGEERTHCGVGLFDLSTGAYERVEVPGDGPSGRYGFAFAYDEENRRLILFSGGQEPSRGNPVNAAADVWSLDLGERPFRWTRIELENPPGRRNACFAFDSAGARLFVWGGTPNAQDVLDGLQVLELDPGRERWVRLDLPNAPAARSSCGGTFDLAKGRALFGFGNTREEVFVDLHALEL